MNWTTARLPYKTILRDSRCTNIHCFFFYTRLKGAFYTFFFGASIIGGKKIIGFMNSIPG